MSAVEGSGTSFSGSRWQEHLRTLLPSLVALVLLPAAPRHVSGQQAPSQGNGNSGGASASKTSTTSPYYLLFAGTEGTLAETRLQSSHAVADYIFAAPLGDASNAANRTTGPGLNHWPGFWLTTEVRLALFPDLGASETGKTSEAAAIDKPKALPTIAVGVQKILTDLSDATHLEAFASFGTMIGDPPRENPSGSDRLFWEAGVKFETNYGLAAPEKDKPQGVIGSAKFSYLNLNYLHAWAPAGGSARNDNARFVANFQLSSAAISSNSTQPFVYLIIDRSLGRSRGLNFDRAGFAAVVNLEAAFKNLLPASAPTAQPGTH